MSHISHQYLPTHEEILVEIWESQIWITQKDSEGHSETVIIESKSRLSELVTALLKASMEVENWK